MSVRYMAQLRAAAGVAEETVDVDGPCTASGLAARLAAHHGDALRRLLLAADGRLSPIILAFVGDAQVGPNECLALKDGDVVTLLSPIAGG
ncbi:MAG TPA: MoaD/ThiS family protein [Gemmataceae bacterium]|nr:MoaD/ThiS family protein [Gemmataceae bacterium]